MSRPYIRPSNGHDDQEPLTVIDLPERVDALTEEVSEMRDEMRMGFSTIGRAIKGLKTTDAVQQAGLWAITKSVAAKSTLLVFGSAVGSAAVQVAYRIITGHH